MEVARINKLFIVIVNAPYGESQFWSEGGGSDTRNEQSDCLHLFGFLKV